MTGLNAITTMINQHFVQKVLTCSDKFTGAVFYPVVTSATRGETPGQFPVIFDNTGRGQYIGIDEINPFMMYHRTGQITMPPAPRSGYGHKEAQNVLIAMRAAIYHDRRRIPFTSDEMGFFIMAGFPPVIENVHKFDKVKTRINGVITDTNAAFGMEYPATPYFIKPEHSLIVINYQLETPWKPECFNPCIE